MPITRLSEKLLRTGSGGTLQVTASLAVTASTVPYSGLTGVPSGIVSSSTQFNSVATPFTGSFRGTFTSSLATGVGFFGTASYALTPAGTSGTSGATGTSGTSGVSGTSGTSGLTGTSGTSGANGTSGTSGATGTSGTSGLTGTSGTSGANGTSGSSGANGTSGTSGTRGTSGSSGANGTSGTSGANGTSGTSGANGTSGTSGTSGANGTSGSSGANGTSGTSGANGAPGTSGTSGANGTSGSSGANGAPGTSGTSGTSSNGTSGTSGTSGANGTSGSSGANGTSGSSGANGAPGTSGTSGASGTSGSSGANGTSGTSGLSGTSGTSGLTGTSGTSGANGANGTSGTSGAGTISGGAANRVAYFSGATTLTSTDGLQYTGGELLISRSDSGRALSLYKNSTGAGPYMTFFNNGSNELDFGRSDAISGVGSNYDIMTYTARGLAFYTNNVYTPKMIISSSGLVGIGITTPAYLLDVSGSTRIVNSLGVGTAPSGVQGEIRATNEITAYYGASDVRLKENVKTIKNSLDRISQIRGVEFDWTDDYIKYRGGEDGYFVRKHQYGVIAQEVAEVFPELVNIRDNGHMVVDYQHFNAVLIEAIKELKAEIDELKRKG